MREIITFTAILGLIATMGLNLTIENAGEAQTGQYAKQKPAVPVEVEGKVTKVKGNTLTVTDGMGRIYQIKTADPRTFEWIQVGDIVRVEGAVGQKKMVEAQRKKIKVKAISIERIRENGNGGYMPESVPPQPIQPGQ
jgi:RecJ-like exonuclease